MTNIIFGKVPLGDSGTKTLTSTELKALVDEDTSTNAYTLDSENAKFKADLTKIYQVSEVRYYTDETTLGNVEIKTSEDDVDYTVRALSQETGYIKATVNAPARYIKVSHTSTSLIVVKDIQVIGDDTRVDFGTDGSQIELNFTDNPIGSVGDAQTIKVYNDHASATTSAKCNIKADGSEGSRMTEISNIQQDTDDLTLGQTYDASSAPTDAHRAFDDDLGNQWYGSLPCPQWISCQWSTGKVIRKLTLRGGYFDGTYTPRYCKLEGSNNGADWAKVPANEWDGVYAQQYNTDEIEFGQEWHNKLQWVKFNNDTSYTYYRLYITDNWGASFIQIMEIEMMELADWKSHCANNDLTNHVCLQSNANYNASGCCTFCNQYNKEEVSLSDQTIPAESTCDVFARSNIPTGEENVERNAKFEAELNY